MSVRSLVGLIVLVAAVAAALWMAQLNSATVTVRLPGLEPLAAPLWTVLFLSLLSGILLAFVYTLATSSRDALTSWRGQRAGRPGRRRAADVDRGLRLLVAGEDRRARELLERVARQDAGNADAWLHAGIAARRLGDAEAAQRMHLRVLGLRPDDPRVLEELSRDTEEMGDVPGAVRYLRQAIEHGGAAAAGRRLRDLHLRAGSWEAAISAQKALVERVPDGDSRRRERAILAGMRIGKGRRTLAAGDARGAAEIARALIGERPDYEPAHALLVDALLAGDDPTTALDALHEAVERTGSLELLRREAGLLVDAERPEEAIRTLRTAVENAGGERRLAARILLGRLYDRLELVDEAFAEFRTVAEDVEFSAVVNYYLAKLHARRGEHRQAQDLLQEALRRSHVLDLRYRCPECGTIGPEYARRCHDLCAGGMVQMDVRRDVSPSRPVEPPKV